MNLSKIKELIPVYSKSNLECNYEQLKNERVQRELAGDDSGADECYKLMSLINDRLKEFAEKELKEKRGLRMLTGITYDKICKVNNEIKTTPIKGKEYAEVNERINAFRKICPGGCISTEIVSLEDGMVVMKASVINEEGQLLGTGTAFEKETSSFINKTSYIENCETSAVGRALAMCGFGITTSVASKEEVENAINNQDQPNQEDVIKEAQYRTKILKYIGDNDDPKSVEDYIKKTYKVKNANELNLAQCEHFEKTLKANGKELN